MNLYIYLNDCYMGWKNFYCIKTTIKFLIKKYIFNKDMGGHTAVRSCILDITKKSNGIYLNKSPNKHGENYALVIGGIDILKAVMTRKKEFSKLTVGPNMVHNPLEHNKLLFDKRIDALLVPSENVKAYYKNIFKHENILKKIKVWSAFPTDLYKYEENKSNIFFIIYIKDRKFLKLIEEIKKILNSKKIDFICFYWGNYKKDIFFKSLQMATHIIFFGNSESQCIAQFEAYSYGLEILVHAGKRYKTLRGGLESQFIYPNYLGNASPYSSFLNSKIYYHNYEILEFLKKFDKNNFKLIKNNIDLNNKIFDLKNIIIN